MVRENLGRAGEDLGDGHESKQLLGEPGVEEKMVVWPGSLLTPTTGAVGGRRPV